MIPKNEFKMGKNGLLLKETLGKAGVGQRECALGMGEYPTYLTNFLYQYENRKVFPRSFSYHFLASIYLHNRLKLNPQSKDTNRNLQFKDVINDESINKLHFREKILIPMIEHHILAITKINKNIFNESYETIIENYIEVLYKENFDEYESFLKDMDHERVGFDNLSNLKKLMEEEDRIQGKKNAIRIENTKRYNKNLEFERKTKLIKDFYFFCENCRKREYPNFYSPADFIDIQFENNKIDGFLVNRNIINKLKRSEQNLEGQFIWRSGNLSFKPEILKKTTNLEKYSKLPFKDIELTDKQKKKIDQVFAKGDAITLFEIDELINKYRGSFYLQKKLKNDPAMRKLFDGGLDMDANFEEARIKAQGYDAKLTKEILTEDLFESLEDTISKSQDKKIA